MPFLFEHRRVFVIVVILSIFGAIATLAQPLLVGLLMNRVQAGEPLGLLVWGVLARSRCSPAWHPSPPTAAKSPPGTGSTATATGTSTRPCTPWSEAGSSTSQPPATTSLVELLKARPAERSNAASPATSPETSTGYLKVLLQLLDKA